MLAHRLRHWSKIKPTLAQSVVFAGKGVALLGNAADCEVTESDYGGLLH